MSLALRQPVRPRVFESRASARRAVTRWAWRMFRREWRRQILILALLTLAVAATTVGLAVISNSLQLGADPTFGTANTILTLNGSDPNLTADIATVHSRFGPIDVVTHQSVAVPGSVSTIDLRAENPKGPFAAATVRLDSGAYPTGPNEVAVTSSVAQTFDIPVGSVWHEAGRALQVVGLVENPLNLLDQFALLAPGQVTPSSSVSILVNTPQGNPQALRLPSGSGGIGIDSRGTASKATAEGVVLVLATIGLLFVGLLAVAGFAVMAQRRLRSLGMLSSLGATDRQVRLALLAHGAAVGLTSAAAGGILGLAGWFVFAPSLQSIVEHRIDRFDLPWWAIAASLALAFATAVLAAWWPARAVSRIPIVAALSGRPPRPQPAHRFAAAGGALLGTGLVLLAFADQRRTAFILTGTVATVVGILLASPLVIQAVAKLARRCPVATRMALRDLARYQARSGAALSAATLAIAVAATIAISAAAAQTPSTVSNLPTDQLILYIGPGAGAGNQTPVVTSAQQESLNGRVDALAGALHANAVVPLEAAYNPAAPIQATEPGQPGGQTTASMARVTTQGRGQAIEPLVELYVATPTLLSHFGINQSQISATADVVTSRTDLGSLQIFLPQFGPGGPGQPPIRPEQSGAAAHPSIQVLKQLPSYTSDPVALITDHGMQTLGLQPLPAGWLMQTPQSVTKSEIDTAQRMAASVGLSVETKSAHQSLASLRNWSTAVGILVALGVLAMTVGLIRSETARDLRTLAATGASSTTRRALTAATAGALALLGAILGTAGAYAALLAWHRSNLDPLTNIPLFNLVIIVVALPVIATASGWLLAGREPQFITRQPLD